ncbi:MAG: DarT ssDNA thymidine ADP-ribosyltransferase family protein [Oscillospiraceae bacterium]|nr:DarT ssDNA thymidine ADP-ribosyltransferase family protein [Oscillospiraceae bacterium]
MNISEYELKNKNPIYKTVKLRNDDIDEIKTYLDSRNVASFLHFSPICNLDSILKNGICSRNYCDRYGIKYQYTDATRYDNLKDFISLSISFPNYQMRYKKEQEMKQRFIIIEIDPSIIKKFDIDERLFCNVNASSKAPDKAIGPDLKHLEYMFACENMRKDRDLPLYYTTEPQAEILLKGPIPIEYFKKIYFDNNSDFSYYFEKYHSPLFAVDRKFFTYRKDYAYYQNHNVLTKEDNTVWQEDLPF